MSSDISDEIFSDKKSAKIGKEHIEDMAQAVGIDHQTLSEKEQKEFADMIKEAKQEYKKDKGSVWARITRSDKDRKEIQKNTKMKMHKRVSAMRKKMEGQRKTNQAKAGTAQETRGGVHGL